MYSPGVKKKKREEEEEIFSKEKGKCKRVVIRVPPSS